MAKSNKIEYIFNNKNLGYGKAHNIAMKKALETSKYHLVSNPDIEFKNGTLEAIYNFMEAHKNVGQLMPKVFYDDGNLQKLCHLLPKPTNLIARRFFIKNKWSKKINDKYELRGFNYNKCLNTPSLSGCFMFLRTGALKKSGLFDERFFMYMEDIDLTRRIHQQTETLFFPFVEIKHGFAKESFISKLILTYHITSAIKYFNKWGWFFDKQRTAFNKRVVKHI